ncbi:type II secretion system F family protein [Fructilactobacillus myrtifloralis]|uniref:Type II secretion system F family protein n=1 Tax=Fructilactobacillus myrtifloralis TaxID=2940301 RepID=A0ABY5BPT8_9LACO|nr:type II secretion system F family protein [Fructilactobacillus myrtifloralis]USS85201.1 type II secretion system F family protein [Fructilactobacillus myrtifloralis]
MNVMKRLSRVKPDAMPLRQQAAFFGSLSELIHNGFSLAASLDFIATTAPENTLVVTRIQRNLEAGTPLSQAMQFFLAADLYQQLRIAEEHGDVITGMLDISRFIQLTVQQRQKLKALAVYPLCLLGLLVTMMLIIKLVIMPQTASLLPTTPQQSHLDGYLLIGAGLVISLSLGLGVLIKTKRGIQRAEFLIRLPLVGKLFRHYYQYYLASNLALMLKNGLDLQQIITVFRQFAPHSLLQEVGTLTERSIQTGTGLLASLRHYHFVAPEMIAFLENGSEQRTAGQNLLALSELYFQRLMRSSEMLIKLVQPGAFLLIGLLIFLTYLQMLLPMYQAMKGIY